MNLKMAIVPKISKLEWDIRTLNLTREEVLEKYRQEGVSVAAILKSHQHQKTARRILTELLEGTPIIDRDNFSKELASKFDLIIALGGDNHFQYVSHFLDAQLLVGINSDPSRSEGALTYFTVDTFKDLLKSLQSGNFQVENWTRLQVALNGKNIDTLSTCDIFLGEAERKDMSRHIICLGKFKEEQKNSGLLVTTGAGSTSWYDSACRYCFDQGNTFLKDSRQARFLATEPYKGKLNGASLLSGEINTKQKLIINSLNDNRGKIIIDSLTELDFNRGAKATIGIANQPLKVVVPTT